MKEAWERATSEVSCPKCAARALHLRDFKISEPTKIYGNWFKIGSIWRICKECKNEFNIYVSFIPEWAWAQLDKDIAKMQLERAKL